MNKPKQSEDDETVQSAERFVTDVESRMRSRVHKARESAREAENEQDKSDKTSNKDLFWSPPIIGAKYKKRKYSTDEIWLEFINELPNGKKYMSVFVPEDDEINDKSHELNRLLSFNNIELENISDLTGCRIPIHPKGYEDRFKNTHNICLDYPPIQTRLNNIKYRTRRSLERLGIIRWGKTPRLEDNNRILNRCTYFLEGTYNAPKISCAAFPFTKTFQENNIQTHVLTEKGAALLFISGLIIPLITILMTSLVSDYITTFFVSTIFTIIMILNLVFHRESIKFWYKKGVKKAKNRLFPQ